jgi:nitrogen fixation protein NifU and related proteins
MSYNLEEYNLMEHYKSPKYKGVLENFTHQHNEENVTCGDKCSIQVVTSENKYKDIKFTGEGCVISQAAADLLIEELEDMSLDEINKLSKEDMLDILGIDVSARRIKCALLPLLTIQNLNKKIKGEDSISFIDLIH